MSCCRTTGPWSRRNPSAACVTSSPATWRPSSPGSRCSAPSHSEVRST
uniref:Uncharacterized protein n=1 Tax=Arundo donax TaxID=35708 RepID=A0A0A9EXR8_ARUDO